MIEMHHVVVAVVVAFVVLLVFSQVSACGGGCANNTTQNMGTTSGVLSTEKFDAHRNHAMGAKSIYKRTNPDVSLDEAERDARYEWSHRDIRGLNIYDKFYEEKVFGEYDKDQMYSKDYLHEQDGQHDLKFQTLDSFSYTQDGMREPQLRGHFRGNIITLAQKLEW